jgi:N6-L-threonylcarbamoyladenine synthase
VNVLGIETSCDETSAAVVAEGRRILSNIVATQADLHARYGGVVPEIACRAHVESILPVVEEAMAVAGVGRDDLAGIAVTRGPGLVGALLIGISAAKSLAWAWGLPLVGIHHIEAHIHAARMTQTPLEPPYLALVASGGHTALYLSHDERRHELLGSTTDDAAGEAFDKVASILELGYPGGPAIDRAAAAGAPRAIPFPRTSLGPDSLDFSFSGIKTAVLYHCKGQNARRDGSLRPGVRVDDVAASFQEAMIDMLATNAFAAVERLGIPRLAVVGGVAANRGLRERFGELGRDRKVEVSFPPMALCTDNAAMVAGLAYARIRAGEDDGLEIDADPRPIRALATGGRG